MKKMVFHGEINGKTFNDVKSYNEYMCQCMEKGTPINASSSTSTVDEIEEEKPCPGCQGECSCQCHECTCDDEPENWEDEDDSWDEDEFEIPFDFDEDGSELNKIEHLYQYTIFPLHDELKTLFEQPETLTDVESVGKFAKAVYGHIDAFPGTCRENNIPSLQKILKECDLDTVMEYKREVSDILAKLAGGIEILQSNVSSSERKIKMAEAAQQEQQLGLNSNSIPMLFKDIASMFELSAHKKDDVIINSEYITCVQSLLAELKNFKLEQVPHYMTIVKHIYNMTVSLKYDKFLESIKCIRRMIHVIYNNYCKLEDTRKELDNDKSMLQSCMCIYEMYKLNLGQTVCEIRQKQKAAHAKAASITTTQAPREFTFVEHDNNEVPAFSEEDKAAAKRLLTAVFGKEVVDSLRQLKDIN